MTEPSEELRTFAQRLFARANAQGEPTPPPESTEDDQDPARAFLRRLFREQ